MNNAHHNDLRDVEVVEDPSISEVMDKKSGRYYTLKEFVGSGYGETINRRADAVDRLLHGQEPIVCAECRTPVRLLRHHHTRRFFFRHIAENAGCSAVTRGALTQDQINARKYDGAKESDLHLQTKNWVIESLSLNPRFSGVQAEQRILGAANNWRKPDVQALYACPKSGRTIRIAFEIQLSTTFLDVIRARRKFYLENGALLFWIFAAFEDSNRRLTKDDVFYTNNRNAFVVNEKTMAASRAARASMLGCCYTEFHSVVNGKFTLRKKLVNFDDLVLDLEKQEGYYYDYRAELREAKRMLAEPFFKDWPQDPQGAWGRMRGALHKLGVPVSSERYCPRALINSLISAKEGKVCGFRFRSFMEVCHRIKADKRHVQLFRRALKAYNRTSLVRTEDRSGAWARVEQQIDGRLAVGDSDYDEDTTYYEELLVLFPELYPHTV